MKSKKKVLVTLLCAALLVFASVMGTLAWMTSTPGAVTNTFTVGNIEITLDETKVDEYGVAAENAGRTTANTYKMIPGKTYTKDPEVHVTANSEKSYVFVKVENGLAAFEAADNNIKSQILGKDWIELEEGVYYKVVEKMDTVQDLRVFDTFTLADNANDIEGYRDAQIVVTAYAIQYDELDVNTAWETVSAVEDNQ